jgi:hypothetical protein
MMICIESGVTIGLVESRDEYQESKRRRPIITLFKKELVAVTRKRNATLPLSRFNFAPGFPSHINVRHAFKKAHVKYLALGCGKEAMSLCNLQV